MTSETTQIVIDGLSVEFEQRFDDAVFVLRGSMSHEFAWVVQKPTRSDRDDYVIRLKHPSGVKVKFPVAPIVKFGARAVYEMLRQADSRLVSIALEEAHG